MQCALAGRTVNWSKSPENPFCGLVRLIKMPRYYGTQFPIYVYIPRGQERVSNKCIHYNGNSKINKGRHMIPAVRECFKMIVHYAVNAMGD